MCRELFWAFGQLSACDLGLRVHISVLGKPGSGKSRTADCLSRCFHIVRISSGALVRAAIEQETEIGSTAAGYVDRGDLLPEGLVDLLVIERLLKDDVRDGWILDGYPRRLAEAKSLETVGERGALDALIYLQIADPPAVQRLLARWSCDICGGAYGLDAPPAIDGVCDECGAGLSRRVDDDRERINHRLEVFRIETEPLLEYYKGIVITIDASRLAGEVCADAQEALKSRFMD